MRHVAYLLLPGSFCISTASSCTLREVAGSGGDGSTSQSSATGATLPCGDAVCDVATEYCGFAPGTCGGTKSCRKFDRDCGVMDATCGCDGASHLGPCGALHDSGGIESEGACPAPTGKFNCTYEQQVPILCDSATDYCIAKPGGGFYSLTCAKFSSCTPSNCHCADIDTTHVCQYQEGIECSQEPATGGVTLLCP